MSSRYKKYDIYYSSGWFSKEQEENYKKITERLKEKGFSLFEPREETKGLNSTDKKLTKETAKKIFDVDLEGLNHVDLVFADITFKDRGVDVEIGYCIAKNIPFVLFDNSGRPVNLMLSSQANGFITNFEELEDWLSGSEVFHEDLELQ